MFGIMKGNLIHAHLGITWLLNKNNLIGQPHQLFVGVPGGNLYPNLRSSLDGKVKTGLRVRSVDFVDEGI